MAKDTTDEQTTEFNYDGLYNDDNPVDSLSDLDLGDEVEPSEPSEEDEPTSQGEEAESELADDESGEGEETVPADEAADDDTTKADEPDDAEGGDETAVEEDQPVEKEAAKAKQPFIPKSRFDQRTAQLRAAERELEAARGQLKELETARQKAEREANTLTDEQIQTKMSAANAALLEGNTDEAARLQGEVFGALRQGSQVEEQAAGEQVDPNKIAADVRDQMVFETTLERLYNEYPALNENSDQFDEAVSQEAVELQAFYFQQGYTRAESTERAVAAVSRIHGLQSPEADAPVVNKKVEMAKRAQTESKRGKVEKARKAPPATGGSSGRSEDSADHTNVDDLTVEDWSALPDSVRARLLGDAL